MRFCEESDVAREGQSRTVASGERRIWRNSRLMRFGGKARGVEAEQTTMGWWSRMTSPLRRFSFRIASRLGFRKRGLLKLGRDVRACEYGDVQVMWEMVKRNEKEVVGVQERRRKRRSLLNILWWGGSGACIGCRF
ncbi:hypothetical protein SDJN02_13107, partial [Cucurbita argyrosperma subsp. argyrosperma]